MQLLSEQRTGEELRFASPGCQDRSVLRRFWLCFEVGALVGACSTESAPSRFRLVLEVAGSLQPASSSK